MKLWQNIYSNPNFSRLLTEFFFSLIIEIWRDVHRVRAYCDKTSIYFCRFFTDVMPRSLDTIPSVVQLLIAVITESILVLLASIYNLRRFHEDALGTEELSQTGSHERRKPAKMTKKGTPFSKMCCEGNSRVNILYPTVPVSVSAPDKLEEKEEVEIGAKGKHVPRRLSAQLLDWRCFVAVFVGISIYLLIFLTYSIAAKASVK